MRSLRLILALGTMLAGFAMPAFASSATKHKTTHHETSTTHHAATTHEKHHSTTKQSTHHSYKTSGHKTYHHYVKPKPKPKPKPNPGIRSDGRYVLPGGLETTCAGGTPPPCR
jgi:hypothetical protein